MQRRAKWAGALVRRRAPVNRLRTRQARGELADAAPGQRVLPFGGDRAERAEHEGALCHGGMGNREGPVGPGAARPEQDIEIERECAPTLAGAATEARLDFLQAFEYFGRRSTRLNSSH